MYNRRTPKQKQKSLSIDAKIESVLKFWNMKEVFEAVKDSFDVVKRVFENRIKNDLLMSNKSKNFIKYIIYLKSKKIWQI